LLATADADEDADDDDDDDEEEDDEEDGGCRDASHSGRRLSSLRRKAWRTSGASSEAAARSRSVSASRMARRIPTATAPN